MSIEIQYFRSALLRSRIWMFRSKYSGRRDTWLYLVSCISNAWPCAVSATSLWACRRMNDQWATKTEVNAKATKASASWNCGSIECRGFFRGFSVFVVQCSQLHTVSYALKGGCLWASCVIAGRRGWTHISGTERHKPIIAISNFAARPR